MRRELIEQYIRTYHPGLTIEQWRAKVRGKEAARRYARRQQVDYFDALRVTEGIHGLSETLDKMRVVLEQIEQTIARTERVKEESPREKTTPPHKIPDARLDT